MNIHYKLYELGRIDLDDLSCESETEFFTILEWLEVERWINNDPFQEKKKYVDLNKDFDLYNTDFIRFYKINLKTDDLDYFTFKELFQGLFSYDSRIASVVKFRSYTKGEHDSAEYAKEMKKLKNLYDLGE